MIPIQIENKINQIPNSATRNTWPFKILDKTSASASLVILTNFVAVEGKEKGCPRKVSDQPTKLAIKTWCKQRKMTKQEESLEYEKEFYIQNIHPLLRTDPSLPFLSYVGDDNNCSTVQTLANYIGANDVGSLTTLCLAFYILNLMYTLNIDMDALYNSKTFYRHFFGLIPMNGEQFEKEFNEVLNWPIGAILLPLVKFKPFKSILGTDIQVDSFRQVVRGTYTLSTITSVHNDLHLGNIMIEDETNKVKIYDWDRAYSVILGDNPILTNNTCSKPCSFSQCNIFINKRPTDLLKFLCYIQDKVTFDKFLQDGLRLPNILKNNKLRFDIIYEGIRKCGAPPGCFYHHLGCTALYKPGYCKKLEDAITELGLWDEIIARAFPEEEKEEKIDPTREQNAKKYSDIIRSALIASAVTASRMMIAYRQNFSFGKEKFGMLLAERPVDILGRREIEKSDDIKIDKNMAEQIDRLTKYPLDGKMMEELNRLEKIPIKDMKMSDYVKLKDIAEYIQYGPPVVIEEPVEISAGSVKAVSFGEILQSNEDRKGQILQMIEKN